MTRLDDGGNVAANHLFIHDCPIIFNRLLLFVVFDSTFQQFFFSIFCCNKPLFLFVVDFATFEMCTSTSAWENAVKELASVLISGEKN
jgi:hypothetical protein